MKSSNLPWLLLAGCVASPVLPATRFANAPPVLIVNDRRDVPVKPGERTFFHSLYHYDGIFQRRITRGLELPRQRRALGVNALDEVPDSTWFTNRIGVRDLSLEELATGPTTIESPELHLPWTIKSTKVGGSEIGFIVTDARGEKFLIKFDSPGHPEQETATHVIVGKLLWAFGYNVTEDFVVYFRKADLKLAADAVYKDDRGKHHLDQAELDRRLAQIEIEPDGRIRAMASRYLDGKPLGGPPAEGVREDDPNDLIPHQLRRDLRGAFPVFAWLDHEDVQESNFLDMWVKDRGDAKRHYVKHYALDFGKSLGVMASTAKDPRAGYVYIIDLADMTRSLVTAGALDRPWEQRETPTLRGVGLFDASTYDPATWTPNSPAYVPFLTKDRIDGFWAAKILIRFTRDQLHAVVASARLSDPRAIEYITDILVARQRATAQYWFEQTNPLDRFAVDAAQQGVCFDDLMLAYRLAMPRGPTHYVVTSYDRDERVVGAGIEVQPGPGGHTCASLTLAPSHDAYTVVRIDRKRPDDERTTYVHVARDPSSGALRVVGIWRP